MGNFCSNCGNKLNEGANFCNHCGSKVTLEESDSGNSILNKTAECFGNAQMSNNNPFQNISSINKSSNNTEIIDSLYSIYFNDIKKIIAKFGRIKENQITLGSSFSELGVDSIVYVEICLAIKDCLGVYILEGDYYFKTVKGCVDYVYRRKTGQQIDFSNDEDQPSTVSIKAAIIGGIISGFKNS